MILLTRPEHETATRYISRWAEEIILLARQKNHQIIDLHKQKATRRNIESYLKKQVPRLVMFNGHGSSKVVCGHEDEVLIKMGENEDILRGKIVYALACSSAQDLGPSAVAAGATAYIGYKREYIFFANANYISHPLDDNRAKPYFDSSNSIVASLLKGHTVKEACDKGRAMYQKSYSSLLTSEATKDDISDAMALRWNMLNLTYSGESDSKA